MLNLMRRGAKTWVIKILLLMIALSFVVWGVGDYVNKKSQLPVAEGSGWAISQQEFAVAYDNELNSMRARFGGGLDKKTAEALGMKQRTLNTLINHHLVYAAVRKLHLAVSPNMLRDSIAGYAAFQVGGQFDPERYRLLLRSNHMTPREFESQMSADMVTKQLQQVIGTTFGPPELLWREVARLESEKRVVYILKLKPKALEADIKPTDEELTTFLEAHKDRFMTPVQVKLRYLVLDSASVKSTVTVSDEEIKTFYEENLDDFRNAERRNVSHILARETPNQADPKDPSAPPNAAQKSALERIRQAQERLDKGEVFATVAKELSDDSSKSQGGNLGDFARGVMVQVFEDVAFSLPVGKVSDPVKSEFGYHLILVNAVHPGVTKTLEQVTDEVKDRLLERKSQELVYDRSGVLGDQIAAAGDLKTIATDFNLRYRETDFFSRDEEKKLETIEHESKFLDAAFATQVGSTSDLIEVKEGHFVALQVVERKEPTLKPLSDARDAVTNLFKNEKAHDQAQTLMGQALKLLQEGKTWQEAAAVHLAIQAEISEPFTRNGGKGAPSPAVRAASLKLSMEKPLHTEVLKGLEELVVVRLQKIQPASAEELEESGKKTRTALQQTLGQEQMAVFLDGLRRDARVEVHPKEMERF